ncbi:DMT family transporter [Chitinibacter bivalviorum]|uniref:DMT family transporter n=1 Tax=Chitinibacter bivalviorum TaxID=2739434 RepID=A0A7H9BKW3_9NEIS|nr:DMT family transporter [Chitinibacter bivalviorum]QLG89317.1 DMT family transporter [Chitinibacter bivalviorum]
MLNRISTRFSSFQIGVLLAIFASTGFAAKAIFVKLAYRYGVDAVTLVTMRMLIAAVLLHGIRLWRTEQGTPLTPKQKWALVGLGLIGYYLSSTLDFLGLQTVSASLERLILCLYPTMTVLFGALIFGAPISARIKRALPVTYFGMVLVLWPDLYHAKADWIGIGFVVASTISFALYMTLSPKVIREVGSMRFTELALTVSSFAIFLHFIATRPMALLLAQPAPVWGYAVLMAVFSTILPVYATNAAMHRIGGSRTALVGSFGPVLTIIFSLSILGEHLSAMQWMGAAIVLSGVWLVGKKD